MDELQAFTQRNGKGIGFHPASVLAVEDLVEGVGKLQGDEKFATRTSRTEITLHIELSQEEIAMYEALLQRILLKTKL